MAKTADALGDVARTIADLDERLSKIESFQRDERKAAEASAELRKTQALSAKPNGSAQHVAEVRRRIEQVPVGEARAILEFKFAQVVQTLASKIRAAARRK